MDMPADVKAAPIEKVVDGVAGKIFAADDLQYREFIGNTSRLVARYTTAVAA